MLDPGLPVSCGLNDAQRRALLALARESLVAHVMRSTRPPIALPDLPYASGVFVTIKWRGALRGCIGRLECQATLGDEVALCAVHAASRDPRFAPVAAEELADLSVELSVLTPLEPIDPHDQNTIVVGRHGLVVEHGRRRGLLLPQVAVEWGWTRDQFLRQTCLKAGLPSDAWRTGAAVFRFAAEVFGECTTDD
jgi:AmmeMemoRadiSam system protein A